MPFATKDRIPGARRALVKSAGLQILAGVREHATDQHDPRQPETPAQLFDLRGHG